jgi:hypothetical protein
MRKLILCGTLLGLLTSLCFAQRGVGRPMGAGDNARMGPGATRTFPGVGGVGSNVGHAGGIGIGATKTVPLPSSVDRGTNPKSVGPDPVATGTGVGPSKTVPLPSSADRGTNPNTVGSDPVATGTGVGPNKTVPLPSSVDRGTSPSGVASDATVAPDVGPNPR